MSQKTPNLKVFRFESTDQSMGGLETRAQRGKCVLRHNQPEELSVGSRAVHIGTCPDASKAWANIKMSRAAIDNAVLLAELDHANLAGAGDVQDPERLSRLWTW
jgi:hypothetical protein